MGAPQDLARLKKEHKNLKTLYNKDIKKLTDANGKLTTDNDALANNNTTLTTALNTVTTQRDQIVSTNVSLNRTNKTLEDETEALKDEVDSLTKHDKILQKCITNIEAGMEEASPGIIVYLKRHKRSVEDNIAELTTHYNNLVKDHTWSTS